MDKIQTVLALHSSAGLEKLPCKVILIVNGKIYDCFVIFSKIVKILKTLMVINVQENEKSK